MLGYADTLQTDTRRHDTMTEHHTLRTGADWEVTVRCKCGAKATKLTVDEAFAWERDHLAQNTPDEDPLSPANLRALIRGELGDNDHD
jgi:hypothetical protein